MSKTFSSETFQKTFDVYVRNWHISEAVLFILAFLPFLAYGITEITPFQSVWYSLESILGNITFGAISFGIISFGSISFGVISIGAVSFGVIAIGTVSCGIITIGVTSFGFFAFGNAVAVGLIAISTGSTWITPRIGGNAFGVITIGRHASGVYSLSYKKNDNSVYQFSPERQDIEAVTLFTSCLRKFKKVYV